VYGPRNSAGLAAVLALLATLICTGTPRAQLALSEIDRGHSWVSPYWGYSTPKLVTDGQAYYTAGLWGDAPATAEGVLYKYADGRWVKGARLPGIYQPATLLLDGRGRLIVVHSRSEKPAVFLRSRAQGDVEAFDTLPAPPDMVNAYYIGVAIREARLYIAYITSPSYTMYLARLDLDTRRWTPSAVVCEGQVETKPKTAWTYPILVPDANGLHLVASSCPDGGDGNTYDKVWYLYYPEGSADPSVRELVAECPMGHNAYATDMLVDGEGRVHVAYMWNRHVYGDPLPEGSPDAGSYHSWRDPEAPAWHRIRLGPVGITGLFVEGKRLTAVTQRAGTLTPLQWSADGKQWQEQPPLTDANTLPVPPGFFDVLSRSSGSIIPGGVPIVGDGLLPEEEGKPRERVLWALLPETEHE
jgi:hypothetical protein